MLTNMLVLHCLCLALSHVALLDGHIHSCIYEDTQHSTGDVTVLEYPRSRREERSVEQGTYRPIRITQFVEDVHPPMDQTTSRRVELLVGKAIKLISQILRVYPVSGSLKLSRSRDSCVREHLGERNDTKCAVVSPTYLGEECLDDYMIPDSHLEGLYLWPDLQSDPEVVYPEGPGLTDADVVLYVKAEHTSACDKGKIIAYAAYCKLDQFNRPIAGVINFCPEYLEDEYYNEEEHVVVAIHEMFHVLGFSHRLFNMFQECAIDADGPRCEARGEVIHEDVKGQPRLYTPAVSAAAQEHWNCSQRDLGVPLENGAGGRSLSHWETRTMRGSLMTPVISEPHLTVLDPITLSVFEDSGWYRVSYDYAQELPWGRGQGCQFADLDSCPQNSSQYEVRVNSSDEWVQCPPGTTVHVPGYDGMIQCPPTEFICRNFSSILDLIEPTPPVQFPPSTTDLPVSFEDMFEVHFSLPHSVRVDMVREAFISSLCELIPINRSSIAVTDMDADAGIFHFIFINITVQETQTYARRLADAIQKKEFTLSYQNESFIAYNLTMTSNPSSVNIAEKPPPTPGVLPWRGLLLGVLCSLLVLVVLGSAVTLLWAVETLKRQAAVTPSPEENGDDDLRPGAITISIQPRNPHQVASNVTQV